jgi:hypothetical protein
MGKHIQYRCPKCGVGVGVLPSVNKKEVAPTCNNHAGHHHNRSELMVREG